MSMHYFEHSLSCLIQMGNPIMNPTSLLCISIMVQQSQFWLLIMQNNFYKTVFPLLILYNKDVFAYQISLPETKNKETTLHWQMGLNNAQWSQVFFMWTIPLKLKKSLIDKMWWLGEKNHSPVWSSLGKSLMRCPIFIPPCLYLIFGLIITERNIWD